MQPAAAATVADSLGLSLTEETLRALAPDVEYRLREVIQDASKFMRHVRRSYLTTEDVNQALRLRNVEPQYGFGGRDPCRYLRAAGHADLFFVEDPVQELEQAISAPLPPLPVEAGVIPHWLAVDGRQPAIPENAPLERPRIAKRPRSASRAGPPSAVMPAPMAAAPGPPVEGLVASAAGAASGEEVSLVRAPLRHVASQELQLYYERVAGLLSAPGGAEGISAAQGGEAVAQTVRAALASLAADPGLQPLVPHLVHLIATQVAASLKDLAHLRLLLSAARALVSNPHIQLATYLHQLMPAVMTCLVARKLGANPAEDHWLVRDAAAAVLAAICATYSSAYTSIAPRVQFQLIKALADSTKPLPTHYGAIVGLAALGHRPVQTLLLPALPAYMAQLSGHLAQRHHTQQRAEAQRVYGVLLQAAGDCVFKHMLPRAVTRSGAHSLGAPAAAGPASRHPSSSTGSRSGRSNRLRLMSAAAPALIVSKGATGTGPTAMGSSADWRAFFGEEEAEEGTVMEVSGGTQVPPAAAAHMRPVNEGQEAAGTAAAAVADAAVGNVLLQAREEDYDVDAVVAALGALFGADLEPWLGG